MQPGIYDNLPNAEYHGGPGISKSGLDLIHRSPLHYQYAYSAANDNEPTPEQAIGTAFHALILEPELFAKTYCLGLRRQDVPDAIEDREILVGMVQELNEKREAAFPTAIRDKEQLIAIITGLNKDRKPKLSTSGTKADQIARLVEATADFDEENRLTVEQLEALKGAELKALFDKLNENRLGLLSTSGSTADLAAIVRANGVDITLWSEICDEAEKETGVPFIGSTSGSRHDMAEWLRANGQPVRLWSDVQAEWLENNPDRIVLSEETWDKLMAMREAVYAHPMARKLLEAPGVSERSYYWVDERTGILCRCRPDRELTDMRIFLDVKTTDDASPEGFARSITKWRYDVQDPFYRDGYRAVTGHDLKGFVFLAVEKKPPYAVGLYTLAADDVALGRAQYRADLDTYAKCQQSDEWPGYGDKIQTITLPAWHANKNAYLLDAAE